MTGFARQTVPNGHSHRVSSNNHSKAVLTREIFATLRNCDLNTTTGSRLYGHFRHNHPITPIQIIQCAEVLQPLRR